MELLVILITCLLVAIVLQIAVMVSLRRSEKEEAEELELFCKLCKQVHREGALNEQEADNNCMHACTRCLYSLEPR